MHKHRQFEFIVLMEEIIFNVYCKTWNTQELSDLFVATYNPDLLVPVVLF